MDDTSAPSHSPSRPLRHGWTTGTCATAAAAAAYQALLTGIFPDAMTVRLPRGGEAQLPLARGDLGLDWASAGVIKDAGDDPDVTNGALVVVLVRAGAPGSGVTFRAGEGVGTITLPGLPLPPGEPAINPGPRAMITAAIDRIAKDQGASGDVEVCISIPGGAALAAKTLNARLGIQGGLSILGTTGIVVPFSCAAWIHSIHRGIDVARAAGHPHVAAATGSTSEAAVRRLYDLPESALIDMGDFVGGTLKYLRRVPVPRLTVAGGFAKLAKLAQGRLFLHSSKSQVDIPALAGLLPQLGASDAAVAEALRATSAAQVLAIANRLCLPLADRIAADAQTQVRRVLADGGAPSAPGATAIDVEVIVYDRAGTLIGRAPFAS